MDEDTKNDQPLEEQPEETVPVDPGDQPLETHQPHKFKLTGEFVAGFLGWYLVGSFVYVQIHDAETLAICGGVLFPVNVVVLILFLRYLRQVGWGMLSALAANLVVSLILGLAQNAFCFIPFYSSFK